jgi:hypothetical protein
MLMEKLRPNDGQDYMKYIGMIKLNVKLPSMKWKSVFCQNTDQALTSE